MQRVPTAAVVIGSPPRTPLRPRRRVAQVLGMIGPAFVTAIAYVDPGNVATNVAAGADFGYLLVWVVVAANLVAMLIQYLSAKLGIVTGKSLARVCRERYSRPVSVGLWIQAECVAVATDLAEVLGGAIGLNLLFGVPLLPAGVITAILSFIILAASSRQRQQPFERLIMLFLALILIGFLWSAIAAHPAATEIGRGLVPRFAGSQSVLLATGIVGATVMPHAIYLHSALAADRFDDDRTSAPARDEVLWVTRVDIVGAMTIAGLVNLMLLVAAAAALRGFVVETIDDAFQALRTSLGPAAAIMFAAGLLASGLASSSVGTYAGSVILDGFMERRLPRLARRLATMVPALLILALGVPPGQALVASQAALCVGLPFAIWPLVLVTSDAKAMGVHVNRGITAWAATTAAVLVTVLDLVLIYLMFAT